MYTLDVYLSLVLGRPRVFHDEDINLEMPRSIEDEELSPEYVSTPNNGKYSVMFAPIAHMK